MSKSSRPKNRARPLKQQIKDRVKEIMREQYIHTPQNEEMWDLFEDLMAQVDPTSPKPKVRGALMTGYPHGGKTTCKRQFKKYWFENEPGAKEPDIRIYNIVGQTDLKGNLALFCRDTLKIPDVPENPGRDYPVYILVQKAAKKLVKDGTLIIFIDDSQILLRLDEDERIAFLEVFNDLLNLSHVPIILIGVEGTNQILDLDKYETYSDVSNLKGTFCSRFPEKRLLPWDDPDEEDYIRLLRTIFDQCQLRHSLGTDPFYMDNALRQKVLQLTDGLTGKIIDLIKWTARTIFRQHLPEVITADLLDQTAQDLKAIGW